jgi:hypothetical protein
VRIVDGVQRRFLACLTAFAVLAALAQGMSGVSELVLYLTPLFLIAALLLCGRYVGEDRIVARWRAAVAVVRRARRRPMRWRPRIEPRLRSQHLEGSFAVRGPPAQAAAPAA